MASDPIPSTAVIPVRGNQVFWARRSRPLKFMGGFHSFPGGKIDPDDTRIPVCDLEPSSEAAHVVSVIRELFEETGYLHVSDVPQDESLEADRQALLAGAISFSDILSHRSLALSGRGILPSGTWITPKFQKIRFASYYFMLEIPEGAVFRLNPWEHDEGAWIEPAKALELWEEGRVTLPPPVVYSLQCLAQASDRASALEKLRRPPQIYGMPGKRIEFRRGIQLLPLKSDTLPPAEHTNLYFVGHQKLFLIDPATTYREDRDLLLDYLERLKADGMTPHRIVLTHQHHDHSSAARWLRDTLKIPVMASAITKTLLAPTCPVDEVVEDGQVLEAGERWKLRAIHTPGHAPGHLCFLEEHTHTLFAGDMISGHGTVLISPADGGDMIDYLASLETLIRDFDFDLMLPSHGGSFGDPKQALRDLIEHRRRREEKLLDVAASGVDNLETLVARTYDDVPPAALPYAHLSTLSILNKLRKEGRLEGQGIGTISG